ncbi:MAG: 2-amino-4-hydroxy-6-hydroxymethyldihydropteridine diphosphokinase, partial [Alphaproteobacteria bacterium]|nr:2-amino-4-hydroxy-6-hydroxymethyldihydropteridine diphosphokinase [Alphaproteobacteria bacterium]
SKPQVVEQLLPYGIDIINDVAFGRDRKRDQMMTALARHMGGGLMGYVVMHNVANSDQLEKNSLLGASYRPGRYQDLLADIDSFFGSAIDDVTAAGVARDRIVLDAGFGFGKSLVHSLQLVAQFNTFAHWQLPLLFGISRKSFIGKLLGRGIDQRLHGGMMLEATAMNHGAGIIRVHDVAPAFDLSLMAAALHQQRRPDYIIALGSNMGGREQHMQQAIDELQQLGQVVAQSSFYETAPQYNKEQDYFINGAVLLRADHEPLDLLARLKDIEQRLGRITEVARFQPRPIDLDIIAYGEQQLNLPDLTIPHAAATERAFVLAPLVDLKPFFIFRDIGCYARDLLPPLQRMQGIKKIFFQANLL